MKKPGSHREARARHKFRQSITDRLRELKAGQTVRVPYKLRGKYHTAVVAPMGTKSRYPWALGIAGRVPQVFGLVHDKDGKVSTPEKSYYLSVVDIRGIVVGFEGEPPFDPMGLEVEVEWLW